LTREARKQHRLSFPALPSRAGQWMRPRCPSPENDIPAHLQSKPWYEEHGLVWNGAGACKHFSYEPKAIAEDAATMVAAEGCCSQDMTPQCLEVGDCVASCLSLFNGSALE
jgi:hypothetical protein